MSRPKHEPSPEEIAAMCAMFRETWTPTRYRGTDDDHDPVTVPVVSVSDMRDLDWLKSDDVPL